MKNHLKSFLNGMARTLDISGGVLGRRRWRRPMTDREAWEYDRRALAKDWKAVGKDIAKVLPQMPAKQKDN
jgi:hypothetical protein